MKGRTRRTTYCNEKYKYLEYVTEAGPFFQVHFCNDLQWSGTGVRVWLNCDREREREGGVLFTNAVNFWVCVASVVDEWMWTFVESGRLQRTWSSLQIKLAGAVDSRVASQSPFVVARLATAPRTLEPCRCRLYPAPYCHASERIKVAGSQTLA